MQIPDYNEAAGLGGRRPVPLILHVVSVDAGGFTHTESTSCRCKPTGGLQVLGHVERLVVLHRTPPKPPRMTRVTPSKW
jgi:hypothetical protein